MQPMILRLNLAGQPIEWLGWQDAVCMYSRELVKWTMGDVVQRVHGGFSRFTGERTVVELPSIMACGGERMAKPRTTYPLSNRALFVRDAYLCMYCGRDFAAHELTRDHIRPTSRGGRDNWNNVVAACRRCNQHKADYLLEEIGMELIALPYRPNNAEYLALINSRRILGDQMEFLRGQFSRNARWL
ncbi:MAG: HNH endonuclease [Porticoccaceae bacterium]|nr:HNH endonuclease [Porticoccaceae bacterium]